MYIGKKFIYIDFLLIQDYCFESFAFIFSLFNLSLSMKKFKAWNLTKWISNSFNKRIVLFFSITPSRTLNCILYTYLHQAEGEPYDIFLLY